MEHVFSHTAGAFFLFEPHAQCRLSAAFLLSAIADEYF